jgi:hypothetical protein
MAASERDTSGNPDDDRLEAIANLLLYGSPSARRQMAEELAARDDSTIWTLLAATVTSQDDWRLRARCLEVLGLLAGSARREVAEQLLGSLCAPHPAARA